MWNVLSGSIWNEEQQSDRLLDTSEVTEHCLLRVTVASPSLEELTTQADVVQHDPI